MGPPTQLHDVGPVGAAPLPAEEDRQLLLESEDYLVDKDKDDI